MNKNDIYLSYFGCFWLKYEYFVLFYQLGKNVNILCCFKNQLYRMGKNVNILCCS